jgi:drug/metabolite transporter (DMT)-like permease
LPSSVTPQPWLTAGCFASLVAGLCWLYRVSAQELELRVARFQLRLFAAGIVVIAAFSILFYLTQHSIPSGKTRAISALSPIATKRPIFSE